MSQVEVKCGECGAKLQVPEKLLGTSIKCPKCKDTFVAELGDTYALADDEPAPAIVPRRTDQEDEEPAQRPRRTPGRPRP